ncbi:hypothetical protein [Sphingobacterium sp. UBA2074]|uniref:hypothetical protein n=1 Tax=Sphingobacterium sp. UBA2074 TaxID=1947487 RepID=UPI00257F4EA4|nr:hypothetical protein [Sphingobacterium sp. UBA2074]
MLLTALEASKAIADLSKRIFTPEPTSITKKESPLVLILRTDYEVLVNTYELLKNSELDEEDVSFLLGKPNNYYFDLLDPTEKKRIKQEYLTLFPAIFNVPLDDVLSACINADEEVKLSASSKFNKKSTIFKIVKNEHIFLNE